MYDTERLEELIEDYQYYCKGRITKKGLAEVLKVSEGTIFNVIRGTYNGRPYEPIPHTTRVIANKDFDLIRTLFD